LDERDGVVDPDEVLAELWRDVAASDGRERARALVVAGHRLLELGRGEEALAAVDTASSLLEEAGDALGHCEHNAAVVLLTLDRVEEALERHRRAVERHRARFDNIHAAACEVHVADVLRLLGRHDEALAVYAAAAVELHLHGDESSAGEARCKAGELLLELERWDEAWAELTAARELVSGCVGCVARCMSLLADAHAGAGELEQAVAAATEARALWDACGDDEDVAACDLRLATLLARSQPEEALDRLSQLRVAFRSESDAVSVARCDRASADALEALGLDDEAARHRHASEVVLAAAGMTEAA